MRSRIIIALFALATIPFLGVVAQVRLDSCEYVVTFDRSSATLVPNFAKNAEAIAALDAMLSKVKKDNTLQLKRITVRGAASPDGSPNINMKLSNLRRDALLQYIKTNHNISDDLIELAPSGIAWGKLYEMVSNGEKFEGRERALSIIADNSAKRFNTDTRRHRLMNLCGGRSWWFMYERYFPYLRNASSVVVTFAELPKKEIVSERNSPVVSKPVVAEPEKTEPVIQETVEEKTQPAPEPVTVEPEQPVTVDTKVFPLALSTNLLYDLAAVPNIGIEIPLSEKLSVKADWMYAWWSNDAKHRYWRTYGGDVALRYHFSRGHHLGVIAQMTTYDFELGGRGYQAPRWQWGGGVEYGYSMPIAKRLNLDFSLALGYLTGKLSEYETSEGHYYVNESRTMHYFGPTSAQVSLVWLVPFVKKGGAK